MTMQSASDFLTDKVESLSPSERLLLNLLSNKPRDTDELAKAFYSRKGKQAIPFNGRVIVSSLARSLSKKVAATRGAGYNVRRSERRGPHPITVWIQPRR